MFRLCFSLLTKCCVGYDGGINNDDDKGGDCGAVDDDICTICQDISLKVKQSSEDSKRLLNRQWSFSINLF